MRNLKKYKEFTKTYESFEPEEEWEETEIEYVQPNDMIENQIYVIKKYYISVGETRIYICRFKSYNDRLITVYNLTEPGRETISKLKKILYIRCEIRTPYETEIEKLLSIEENYWNNKTKTYESFEPEEYWEEDINNGLNLEDLEHGKIYTISYPHSDIIFEFDKINPHERYPIKTLSFTLKDDPFVFIDSSIQIVDGGELRESTEKEKEILRSLIIKEYKSDWDVEDWNNEHKNESFEPEEPEEEWEEHIDRPLYVFRMGDSIYLIEKVDSKYIYFYNDFYWGPYKHAVSMNSYKVKDDLLSDRCRIFLYDKKIEWKSLYYSQLPDDIKDRLVFDFSELSNLYESFEPEKEWEEEYDDFRIEPNNNYYITKDNWSSFAKLLIENRYRWRNGDEIDPNNPWTSPFDFDDIDEFIIYTDSEHRIVYSYKKSFETEKEWERAKKDSIKF